MSHKIVKEFSDKKLLGLRTELIEIGKALAPALVEQSPDMKRLFDAEKDCNRYWINQYYDVSRSIDLELLGRLQDGRIPV